MSIFYAAVQDDPLDTGGFVIEGGRCATVEGEDGKRRRMAFLGQQAWCETCKSIGTITAAPGSPTKRRLKDFTSGGRQQALGGDLVLCKCERHPRVVPVHGRKCKIQGDGGGVHNMATTPSTGEVTTALLYDDRFVLHDTDGRALPHTAYAIQREAGGFEYGMTDGSGHTHLLTSVSDVEKINVYLAE